MRWRPAACCARSLPAPHWPIDPELFKRIEELAFQTYAPATAESRAGPGPGLTDND